MQPRLSTFIILFVATTALGFTHACYATGFLDTISDSLSNAGDAIMETGDSIVEGAKEVGKDIGIIEEETPQKKKPEPQKKPSQTTSNPAPAKNSQEKLPGGVSSRLKKMYQELDKVEKKLEKGAGTALDRANRATLDLNRAKGYMAEIEKRYHGQYSPDHPEIIAATERLENVTHAHQAALGKAGQQRADLNDTKENEPIETPVSPKDSENIKAVTPPPANVAGSTEKLPGGVTSRLKNMYKELDKVESKMKKGAGTDVDRANRAKSSLKRAQGYMTEIKKRYHGQYSPDHPEMVAAATRLENVTLTHQIALGEATEKEAERARLAEEKEETERQKNLQAEKQRQLNEQNEKEAEQKQQELCNQWLKSIETYTYGDKPIQGYETNNKELIATWKNNYDEAETVLGNYRAEVPAGTCSHTDTVAELLDTKMDEFSKFYQATTARQLEAKKDMGRFVFSSKPINDPNSAASTTEFKAGDNIYGIIEITKPWSEIYRKKSNFDVGVSITIDDKKIHSQFIKIKTEDYAAGKTLIFNVAPKLKNLVAYNDSNIEYGKTTQVIRQGPNELTHHLSKLSPGSHTVAFSIYYYGKIWAEGSFTITGENFDTYAELHKKIAEGVVAARTLPPAKLHNKKLEKEMTKLLKEAGWSNVYRLNIFDKDWWIERVSGGNSPVKARYMAAVALTKADDGTYFYKNCTFHQDKLITGAFGPLYLSHQGEAVPIPKDNIDK